MSLQQEEWTDRRKQLNPFKWRLKQYPLNIRINNDRFGKSEGSIVTSNMPFILDSITHSYRGLSESAQTGNYACIFSDSTVDYNKSYAMATALYGGSFNGQKPIPLPQRILYKASEALRMRILSNATNLAIGEGQQANIEFVFHGFERWTP